MVLSSWRDGWRRVAAAPALIAGVYLITLLAALPLALSLRGALLNHLGDSLMAGEAADAVNYDWWQEFSSQATGVGTTFTPTIIGFATTLDSFSGLLDARIVVAPIAWALAAYLMVWTFLSGGILDRYARRRATRASGFFAASGTFFFRFLRLAAGAAAVYWFLFLYVHDWLFETWYVRMTRDVAVEHIAFYWRLLMYGIFSLLLAATATVFDFAKVRAVVEDRRSMTGAFVSALRFIARNPSRVAALWMVNAGLFLAVAAIWALIAPGGRGTGFWMWTGLIVSRCYILARLVVKLQLMAAETALFQRSLAHWGYAGAPEVPRAEPPMVEAV